MSKIIVVIALTIFLTCLTGCTKLGDVSSNKDTGAEEQEELVDSDFSESATSVANLIAKTVDTQISFVVCCKFSCLDTPEVSHECFYSVNAPQTKEEKSELAETIVYDLTMVEPVVEAHQRDEAIEITGVILRWADAEDKGYSACDLAGDGTWDYVTEGALFFVDHGGTQLVLENEDGKPISIDEIESKRVKLVQKDDLTLEDLSKIARG